MNLGRDGQRSPMQWDNSRNAGFTTGTPWLPISESKDKYNVQSEQKDPGSMLALYKHLIQFRSGNDTILRGDYCSYQINENVLVYSRCLGTEEYFIALNFSEDSQELILPRQSGNIVLSTLLATTQAEFNGGKLTLQGKEGVILKTIKL